MRMVLRLIGCLLVGVAIGAMSAMAQTWTVRLGGVHVPVGAFASVVTVVLVARACAWWTRSRLGAVAMAAGWLVTTLAMGSTTAGGDLVISSGNRQLGYLIAGSVLLAAACAYPPPTPRGRDPGGVRGSSCLSSTSDSSAAPRPAT